MVHVAYGYGMFTGGLGAHYGVERAGCCAVPMSGGQTEKQVQQIMDFKPEIIMVTPSYSLVIAEEFERLGIKPDEISLKVGIFGAEPIERSPSPFLAWVRDAMVATAGDCRPAPAPPEPCTPVPVPRR